MTFYDVPLKVESNPSENATDLLMQRVAKNPDHPLFSRQNADKSWRNVTSAEFLSDVRSAAKGLIAAGITPGQAVAIMSKTRYEWTVIDFAIWFAGAVTVPIYESSSPSQIEWILSDSDSIALFIENDEQLERVNQIRGNTPKVTNVWKIDSKEYAALNQSGESVSDEQLEKARTNAHITDLATIVYTSGTTGNPKGCELTHKSLVDHCKNAAAELPEIANDKQHSLIFLPLAHILARYVSVLCVYAGIRVGHLGDTKAVAETLPTFNPTFLLAVPRVFEKVYNGAELKAEAAGKGKIFRAAAEVAIEYSKALDTKSGPGFAIKLKHGVFDKLVYSKLRAAMGGQVKYAISGGAPLGARLGHFYRGIGLIVLEGYGLTETAAAAVIGRVSWQKIGKVGRALPGTGIKIADDGEVWLRGINVMRGYWRNEAATRDAFVEDWFRTGDIGELDEDGFLTITGRKKEILVTAGGKNVAPAPIEDPLRAHPLIGQVVVIGDAKPYIGALISLDPEMVPVWCANNGIAEKLTLAEAAKHPRIKEEITAAVAAVNTKFSTAEQIKQFEILDVELTEASGHLTPSLKIKRPKVLADFALHVERIYS
ncbi:long-chain fatty acid--CoA ligase [Aquiluna borgnonia]|uniref:Acyl-CoA synthetase n=1 Tax=Aquiluna borgnonia TaxID=2499157 RepID=A0A7D4UIE2_9MICO|nr:AMP-dependent synthetase/ligase [Aquiluna borgnonia]QKJ25400.1 long-chain fatty acid--CoA ligase [Aquiluna borgnonia]